MPTCDELIHQYKRTESGLHTTATNNEQKQVMNKN